MIRLKNFSVENLYNNVNLEIHENKVNCIVGENGSGKSMLTKYLLGIFNNYTGQILFKENDEYIEMTDDNYISIRKKIKIVVQNAKTQFVGYSIIDEITYKLLQNDISKEQIKYIIDHNFAKFDLNKPLHTLSTAEAQELLILSSLTLDENILIMDEAISNTSSEFKTHIFDLLKENNTTVLLITNNLDDTYYADNVVLLEDNQFKEFEMVKSLPKICFDYVEKDCVITVEKFKFNDISTEKIEFNEGFNVISGRSGIGKTSLVNSLIGLKKYSKEIRTNFQFIGIVSQNNIEQVSKLTVYDQIYNKEISEKVINKILDDFKLSRDILQRDPTTLSTGQLVQILIIQNILRSKECLILDEVMEVIDEEKRTLIFDYLKENVNCVICVSHNLSIFNNYSYNLIEMEEYVQ